MPTAITTSTVATATAAFNGRKLDRCQDGTLWALYAGDATGQLYLRYSKDNGATWSTTQQPTPDGQNAYGTTSSIFIDQDDNLHLVWKQGPNQSPRVAGYIYFARGVPNAGRTAWTWSTAVTVDSTNLGQDFPDVIAHREGTGWIAHVVWHQSNSSVQHRSIAITAAGVITAGQNTQIGGSYGTGNVTYPSIDFNHTGDGKTVAGGTPHLYVGWTAGATGSGKGVRFRKAVYSGGSWAWNPEREIDAQHYAAGPPHWGVCMFDGTRAVLATFAVSGIAGQSDLLIYDRDAADTATTSRTLLNNPTGANQLLEGSATYDAQGNVYLFGYFYDTGPAGPDVNSLVMRKWTRATATLGPATTVATNQRNDGQSLYRYISAKRGSMPGNSIEIVYTDGTSSPYTVQYDRTVPDVNAPSTPYVPMVML